MSVPYRFPDGSFGRIGLFGNGFREQMTYLTFPESTLSIEQKYSNITKDCACPLLTVSDNYIDYFYKIPAVSEYLYGMPADVLCGPKNPEKHSSSSYPDPVTWNSDKISGISWDMFLVAYYLFVFSDSDFSSFYWQQLQQIFRGIGNDDNLFKRVTFGRTRNFHEHVQFFWDEIYKELGNKVLRMCSSETCWLAFKGLEELKETFASLFPERYLELEKKFCLLMDNIAIEKFRTEDRYAIRFLTTHDLDINNIFFYDTYFKLESVNVRVKEEVRKMAFDRFLWAADRLRDNNRNYIAADQLYKKAKEYANDEQESLINSRRNAIVPYIRKQERKERRQAHQEKAEKIIIPIFVIVALAFVVFLILIIISLIFSLDNLLRTSGFGIVVCIFLAVITILIWKFFDPELKII